MVENTVVTAAREADAQKKTKKKDPRKKFKDWAKNAFSKDKITKGMDDFWDIFRHAVKPAEEAGHLIWHGETKNAEKDRIKQEELWEEEMQRKSEERWQKAFNYGLYISMGGIGLVALWIIWDH